jgi:hypothetical protein
LARTDQSALDQSGTEDHRLHTKKKTYGYRERDEANRQAFTEPLKTDTEDKLVHLDKSGVDCREDDAYGWGGRGERVYALKHGRRKGRISIIAALCEQQRFAPFTFEGACNRTVFEKWLEEHLLPMLKPGQSIALDHASFHKRGRIAQ